MSYTKITHCIRGHKFTSENTYVWYGHRHCIKCRTIRGQSKEYRNRVNRKYRTDKLFRNRARARAAAHYRKKTRKEHRVYVNKQREAKKLLVLTHYGKNGVLKCCWRGCTVRDVDMLSIDHIKDDGAEHRRKMRGNRVTFSGKDLYQWLVGQNFPEGFQTLCMNHQVKKQRIKNRAERLDQQLP